ncbi:hemolysin-type calcium-binding region [Nitrosomonas sp. Is79A3]|uniref:calcium-binding protein n=1 Tax=Nitrosomonas sp. (strain Is79A3) TaxID=261292 RepID=UPI000215C933
MDDKHLEVVRTVEAMFNAAPGAHYLNEFVTFIKNTGSSVKELANILAQTDVFKQSRYSDTLSNHAFADRFVENTAGTLVNKEDKSWAASEIEKMLDAGESRGEVIHWAATALASVNSSNTHWGNGAQQFNNKVEVAAYYSIDQGGSATSLVVLQEVTANVTANIGSVALTKTALKSGVSGKIIDGYIKDAIVFADLNGDGIHNANESSATSDALGNFVLPGVTGFGQLIVSGGIDISTGKAFAGSMTAPPGSTVINPLTTLIDKIAQNNAITVEDATAKVLASLGLHPGVDLLHFDPIYETSRTGTDKAATDIALAIHTAAVKVSILISQTAAVLNGAGILTNEAAAIDLTYEALAAALVSNTGLVDLSASNTIAQIIQDTTELSGANNSVLFKIGALATDASQTIANLNKAVVNASSNNPDKSNILSTIAAVQIVSENIESLMKSGAATGSVETTVSRTTGSTLTNAIATAGATVGDVTGDGLPDPLLLPSPPASGGGGGSGSTSPSTVQSYLATNATAFTGTSANDILSVSTAATWTPLVMTSVILDGDAGTNTLSMQDGSSIAAAIVINFPNLTFDATGVTGTNDVTLSASQNQLFTGTMTAAGTGANGEKITIVSDGAITTLTDVENYTVGDDSTNARTITVSNAGTNVTADSTTDANTFNLGTLTYTGTLTGDNTVDDILSLSTGADVSGGTITSVEALTLASGATITLTASQNQSFTGAITAAGSGTGGEKITIEGDGAVTALSNIESYELGDDTTNARTLTTGSAALNLIANNATDTVTINATALAQNTELTLAATSASALAVNSLAGNIVASNLTGTLAITTANAADNGISITTGTAAASVNVAAGAATDTVSIDATALVNNTALSITSGGAAAGTVNITGLTGNLTVSNPASGTIGVTVTDNAVDDGIAIAAGAANLAISGVADGDTVTVTGFTGTTLTGAIANTTGKFNITTGTSTSSITTGAGDDTFTFVAGTGLTTADTVNGGTGTDTVALTSNTAIAATNFNNVSNIEAITIANTNTAVAITTQDTLVAAGATLTLSNAANSGVLTFIGSTETNGKFNITGGTGIDSITGGAGDDTFTFVAGTGLTTDTVNGGTGTDTVTLTGTTAVTAAQFNNVSNIEVISLPNMVNTAVAITTVNALVAASATLTLSNASNAGILTFNGAAETNGTFNITGGTGNDVITGGSGNDTIAGGNGNDSITPGLGDDTLSGDSGNDTFTFAAVSGLTSGDTVDGGTGTDTVALTGNTAFTASTDFDSISNIETITLGNTTTAATITTKDILVAAGATLTLSTATTGGLTFNGAAETDGDFNITSSAAANDTITGGNNADSITCGTGTDVIAGGGGDDTLSFAASTGLTTADTVDGGTGIDTISLTGTTAVTATNFDNVSNIEVISLTHTTTNVAITTKDILVAAGAALTLQATTLTTGILTFNGSAETNGTFNITGGGAADVITGGTGNDIIDGGAGNNVITAGLGNDTITGGSGSETFTFAAATGLTSADSVDGSSGTDTVALTGNTAFTASNDFDNIRNIETITLANTNTAVTITTKDILVASSSTLTLTNAANSGVLTFIGSAETDGTFTINGGTGNDSITGGAGNDTLAGGTGDDTLIGGAGNDSITSGAGNDSITGDAGADTITLGSSANDNTRQTVIYSSVSDGAAAGANSGADAITQLDANANDATDDLSQITGTLKTLLDDDSDGILDYATSDGSDLGNQAIAGGTDQEAIVLSDAEIEIALSAFTTSGLANLVAELGEEIDFTGIATGEECLFVINFSTTQSAIVLYAAGSGGDDTIVASDIQVLGIVTHNDGTGLTASNLTF